MKAFKNPKLILFSIVFLDLLGFGIFIPMLPFFARHYGASAFDIGWLMFAYSAMQFLIAPIWGALSDRIGRRPVLIVTIAGQALAFSAAAISSSYEQLLWSRIFAGLFSANISTASALMADLTSNQERAKGMGLIGAAFGLGFVFGPFIGGTFIHYGSQWPSWIAAGLAVVNLVWAYCVLTEASQSTEQRQAARKKLSFRGLVSVARSRALWVPVLMFGLLTMALVQIEITFGLYLVEALGQTERMTGYLLGGMGLLMAVIQGVLLGKLVQKFSETRLILFGSSTLMLGMVMMSLSFHIAFVFFALVFLAVGYSLCNPCLSSLVTKSAPNESLGEVLGVYQSASALARIVGPLSAGLLYSFDMRGAFVGAVVLIFAATILFLWSGLAYGAGPGPPKSFGRN